MRHQARRLLRQMRQMQRVAVLLPVWQAAESVWVDNMLVRFESVGVDGLVQALQMELSGLQEARLKCN